MKKLHEYETPISNEASFARWTNHAGIQCKTETDSVPVVVSRDLERKLALAMDAMRQVMDDTDYISWGILENAISEIENKNPQC